jgi:hypothetical protein
MGEILIKAQKLAFPITAAAFFCFIGQAAKGRLVLTELYLHKPSHAVMLADAYTGGSKQKKDG